MSSRVRGTYRSLRPTRCQTGSSVSHRSARSGFLSVLSVAVTGSARTTRT